MFYKARHQFQLFLVAFLIFVTCCAPVAYYLMFLTVTFCFLCLYIVDLMFLGENTFTYEPDYNNWKMMNDPEYWSPRLSTKFLSG